MASEPKPALPRASQSSGEDDAQLRALIESAGVEPSSEAAQVLRAVLAAMRLAFASMLSQLDPDRLRDDPDGAFRKLFGDAFAKAYEEQLKRLRGSARSRHE
jgi:hypothetical protein